MFIGRSSLNRHTNYRAFSKVIPHWNLDNSNRKDNEQETSTSVVSIYPIWEYYIISRGLCLLFRLSRNLLWVNKKVLSLFLWKQRC